DEHRKWMVRSFALTTSIMMNRVWGAAAAIVLVPRLSTDFGNNEPHLTQTIAGLAAWLGWTVNLILSQWWLERGRPAPPPAAARRRGRAPRAACGGGPRRGAWPPRPPPAGAGGRPAAPSGGPWPARGPWRATGAGRSSS